jgi:hypothetical protein
MEAAGYVERKDKAATSPQTLAGAVLFSTEKLTPEEEEQLAQYLQFLRSQSKEK